MGRKSIHQLRVCLVLGGWRGNKISHDLSGRSPNDGKQSGNPLVFTYCICIEKISNRPSCTSESQELGLYGSIDPIVAILLISESAGSSVCESWLCMGLHESKLILVACIVSVRGTHTRTHKTQEIGIALAVER